VGWRRAKNLVERLSVADRKRTLSRRSFRSIDHVQYCFGPQARQQGLGQVHPPNRPRLIHQELGRTRGVLSILASTSMDHSIGSNRTRVRVGEDGKRVSLALRKAARFFRRINADCHHLRAARDKFR
jgi:hypothetical protein